MHTAEEYRSGMITGTLKSRDTGSGYKSRMIRIRGHAVPGDSRPTNQRSGKEKHVGELGKSGCRTKRRKNKHLT